MIHQSTYWGWPRLSRATAALLVAIVLCVVGHLSTSDVAARPLLQGGTTVRCEPTGVVGQVGDTLTVDLYVEGASDLYGVDLQLTFDTAIADVVDEDAGLTGVQILPLSGFLEPGFVVRKVADNSVGTVQYANTQLNPTLPANGSGWVSARPHAGIYLWHHQHDVRSP